MKKFLIVGAVIGLTAVMAGVWTNLSARVLGEGDLNCTSTAVIKCGVFSQHDMDTRQTSSSRAIYKDLNISTNLAAARDGVVKASGDIVVDGKVVATNAEVIGAGPNGGGHQFLSGDKGQYIFRRHSAREAFMGDDAKVFVFFNADGTFKNAIAKICGNPVEGKKVPRPVYSCDDLTVTPITRTSVQFASKHTAKDVTYVGTTYIVRDSSGKVVQEGASTKFEAAKPGKYTVEARVTVKVDGANKTVTSTKCKKEFTVEPEPVVEIKVCDLKSKKIITIDEKNFDAKKHSKNLKDCETVKPPVKIEVCERDTKKIITIDEKAFDSKKHTKDVKECEPVPQPPVTPTTPMELPTTGVGDFLASGVGLGSVVLAISYYVASRRNLLG